jgi:hypothetical protein
MLLPLLFAIVLAQAQPAPTPVPNPKPDLSQLMYFSGTWTCHQMLRGSNRPDTSTATMVLNDRWLQVHDVAPPFDRYRTYPVDTDSYYTYDPVMKRFVNVNIDDNAGYSLASTPGWNGNNMLWTDRSALDGSVTVTTITRVNDSEYNWRATGTDGKGKPVPAQSGNCKKS